MKKVFRFYFLILIFFWCCLLWYLMFSGSSTPSTQQEVSNQIAYEKQEFMSSPSKESEELRRRLFHDLKDLSYYVKSQTGLDGKFKSQFEDRVNVLMALYHNLSDSNGMDSWRSERAKSMSSRVQADLNKLQNPSDCASSRKLYCTFTKSCGFGCQMHHVMYCLAVSFYLDRTMILESKGWQYNQEGYNSYFLPLSKACDSFQNSQPLIPWTSLDTSNANSISLPIIDELTTKPRYLPMAVPKQYANEIQQFHPEPFVWWAGQLMSYMMRFSPEFVSIVDKTRTALQFTTPCVGIHVRRTDKIGTEAALHELEEYMQHVINFFDVHDLRTGLKSTKRTVYLASDEVAVLHEAKTKYPEYNFVYNEKNARLAALENRYTPESAQGVILDIYFLSQCDYIVCTFSSQVCRMAYELMQARYADASWRFKSLDDIYYFGGQNDHEMYAIYDHVAASQKEVDMKKGDRLIIAGDHWDGYSKVTNLRTMRTGQVPSYKIANKIEIF